jgi:serine phosphatase RsbU (regulator of sigma subunit)
MASQYVPPGGVNGQEPHFWPLRIEIGDTLVLYTDGLVEARNGKEEYGMKRLRETVAELGSQPAAEIAQGVVDNVAAFTPIAGARARGLQP